MIKIFDDRQIDESNFLDYDIKKLRVANKLEPYSRAIDMLSRVKEVLFIAQKVDRLQSIGNRSYYIEGLRWLKGESPIGTWHSIPQIDDPSAINEDMANSFEQFSETLLSNLQTEQAYSQIELALAVAPEIKSRPLSKLVQQKAEQAESRLDSLADTKIENITHKTNEAIDKARLEAEEFRGTFSSQIEQAKQDAYNQIEERVREASAQLKAAVALDEWSKHYDGDIARIKDRLYGKDMVANPIRRNLSSFWNKLSAIHTQGRSEGFRKFIRPRTWRKFLVLVIKNSLSLLTFIFSKTSSLAGRRTISFVMLITAASVMVTLPLLETFNVIDTNLFDVSDPTRWIAKIALWLPIVIVFSIGYSFTTKNYRIYCNMLDQYQHRRAVARTAQGIILGVDSSDENREFRSAMTSAAAIALFEHKVTGHLSKKEVESLGFLDVLGNMRN